MSECKDKLVWPLLSEEEETERSEVTEKPVSESFSFAEKVNVQGTGGSGQGTVGGWAREYVWVAANHRPSP